MLQFRCWWWSKLSIFCTLKLSRTNNILYYDIKFILLPIKTHERFIYPFQGHVSFVVLVAGQWDKLHSSFPPDSFVGSAFAFVFQNKDEPWIHFLFVWKLPYSSQWSQLHSLFSSRQKQENCCFHCCDLTNFRKWKSLHKNYFRHGAWNL